MARAPLRESSDEGNGARADRTTGGSNPGVVGPRRRDSSLAIRAPKGVAERLLRREWPRRTVRLRLSLVYGALFLVSGAGLLGVTYLLVSELTPSLPLPSKGNFSANYVSGPAALVAGQRHLDLHWFLYLSGLALVLMAGVSMWLGWLMAGRVLRPLRIVTATTRQLSEENLHERLSLAGPDDELKVLGDTIDGLLDRLEGAFEAQRSFVANTSPTSCVRRSQGCGSRSTWRPARTVRSRRMPWCSLRRCARTSIRPTD